jgi:hypothetical protein
MPLGLESAYGPLDTTFVSGYLNLHNFCLPNPPPMWHTRNITFMCLT